MKKVNGLRVGIILGMLVMAMGFVSCNNDDDVVNPTTKEKYTVTYTINSNASSPIFNLWATYRDKDGKDKNTMITEYPWTVSFEVEAPFTAKLIGTYLVKPSAEIPAIVTIAKDASFKVMQGETISNSSEAKSTTTMTNAEFEEYIKTNTIQFDFNYEIKK